MKKISVTTLEKFRRWTSGIITPWDTEQAVIDAITGEFTGTDKTRFGSAYHKILEGEYTYQVNDIEAGGYLFSLNQALPAIEYHSSKPHLIHEIRDYKIYSTGNDTLPEILVSGIVDSIDGLAIRDTKTKYREINWQEYMESYQWRIYLDMMESDVFYYDVFQVKGFQNFDPAAPNRIPANVQILRHETMQCLRYEKMVDDVHLLIHQFIEWLQYRELLHILKDTKPKSETV